MALIDQQQTSHTVLDQIKSVNTNCLQTMRNAARQLFDITWRNDTLTPQQVCDALGTDAAVGFEAHSKLQELIYLLDPSWVPLIPSQTYKKNDDGTVTVGE